jgi:8-oxo-dGTP pyrophosphatase MutT (NUDIX family)
MIDGSAISSCFGCYSSEMAEQTRRKQFAALPYRIDEGGQLEVLLVTSRGTGRWVLPKGWPMKKKAPHQAAAIEAYEEAGAVGIASELPIGAYEYDKQTEQELIHCHVEVYPLLVDHLEEIWPEQDSRTRTWFKSKHAAEQVQEPALQALIQRLRRVLPEG